MNEPWKEVDFQADEMWASLIFARVFADIPAGSKQSRIPIGYVFVIDPKFGDYAKFKMPTGHRKDSDRDPLETAAREFRGETGIDVPEDALHYTDRRRGFRKDHWRYLFVASITGRQRDSMNDWEEENEGEKPKFFSVEEFYTLVRGNKFLWDHYQLLLETLLILPLGRDLISA